MILELSPRGFDKREHLVLRFLYVKKRAYGFLSPPTKGVGKEVSLAGIIVGKFLQLVVDRVACH